MKIAILVFEQMTALDAIGPYEVLARVPGVDIVFVGIHRGVVRTDRGSLALLAEVAIEEMPRPDIVVVPGGPGQRNLMDDTALHDWLRAADATSAWTTSVCTGSLILAAAGILAGRRATSHWAVLDTLSDYGVLPVAERVVRDGKYLTAAGVSSGIDMALTLADHLAGPDIAQTIQLMLEYDPAPPFDAGSPRTAPAHIVDRIIGR